MFVLCNYVFCFLFFGVFWFILYVLYVSVFVHVGAIVHWCLNFGCFETCTVVLCIHQRVPSALLFDCCPVSWSVSWLITQLVCVGLVWAGYGNAMSRSISEWWSINMFVLKFRTPKIKLNKGHLNLIPNVGSCHMSLHYIAFTSPLKTETLRGCDVKHKQNRPELWRTGQAKVQFSSRVHNFINS